MCSGVRNTSIHELTSNRISLPFVRRPLLTFAEQSALLKFAPFRKLPLLSFAGLGGMDAPELFRGVPPELVAPEKFRGEFRDFGLHLGADWFWELIRFRDRFWESDPDFASHFLATRPDESSGGEGTSKNKVGSKIPKIDASADRQRVVLYHSEETRQEVGGT